MFKVKDISFVIITRNESFGIRKCLSALKKISMSNCEIICVDSDSTDDTLNVINEESSSFDCISVYQCKGYLNAAVGRYVGFEKAGRPLVFFLDGDIELNSEFIRKALDVLQKNKNVVAVTGGLDEVAYNKDYTVVLDKYIRNHYKNEKPVYHSGGCIIVRNTAVKKIGSWDISLRSSEDRDFVARLWGLGKVIAIPEQIGIHHTLPYSDTFWTKLCNRHYVSMGVLLRKNICFFYLWYDIIRIDPGPFFGFLVYLLLIFGCIINTMLELNIYLAFMPSICLVSIDLIIGIIKCQNMAHRIFSRYIRVFYILIGFVFGLKANINNVKVKQFL